jgi:hypothetical protein
MTSQLARGRDGAAIVKNGFNRRGNCFLAVFNRFIDGIAGGKTAWKIGDNYAESVVVVARFNGYGVFDFHGVFSYFNPAGLVSGRQDLQTRPAG